MNLKTKKIVVVAGFITVMLLFFFVMSTISDHYENRDEEKIRATIGNVQFKGKVIGANIYEFAGKDYYKICVRLDYCNVKNFFVLNDVCALSIKNNMATMSGSVYNPNRGFPVYVEVNLNRTGNTKFVFKDGSADEFQWLLHVNGMTQADLMACDTVTKVSKK